MDLQKITVCYMTGHLRLNFNLDSSMNPIVFEWTKAICNFRLHWYFEKKEEKL